MVGTQIRIRRACAEDREAVAALETNPYRPEDASEVAAMRHRAEQARQAGFRWTPLPFDLANGPQPPSPIDRYAHVWVAEHTGHEERTSSHAGAQVVGVIAARMVGDPASAGVDTAETTGFWAAGRSLVEVRHLRVAPWIRRSGVGRRLLEQALELAANQGASTVVLNTTAAQLPARELYVRRGFREVGVTYIGEYELVWLELAMTKRQ